MSTNIFQKYCRQADWLEKKGWNQVWQKILLSMTRTWRLSSLETMRCVLSHGLSVRMYNIFISHGLSVDINFFFGGKNTWRSYFLTVWEWETLRTFSFPPKPSSKLPINLPIAQPGRSSVAYKKGCRNSCWSVSQRPWYLQDVILCRLPKPSPK